MSAPLSNTNSVGAVLYLHGFNSASASPKAQLVKSTCQALAERYGRRLDCLTPDLPHQPAAALAVAEHALGELRQIEPSETLIVGSSMGGFLATCLAEKYGLPAVLINPAVKPARFVADYQGQTLVNGYTGETFTVGHSHFDELTAMEWQHIVHPQRYLLLLGSADETLDCRDALHAYAGCRTLIHPGGDHAFDVLPAYLPALFAHGGWQLPLCDE
ncbi:YqiA/YcfP family alpha/beta fold hydrolase [Salinicola rhizosphaerae]|uniref:Esterase n=1 Tax=Salinicola rhizosphaerae TaxID=1443141 RepID=A0ABQ3E7S6_9GAMM|nr:YqiA/YcfP family alpha/beta fold hydrolase [Salinicola rhizosphaerae]GHB28779.1 hypothetical protein GCM10009038_29630 [Salinicola rhizosphaerae]